MNIESDEYGVKMDIEQEFKQFMSQDKYIPEDDYDAFCEKYNFSNDNFLKKIKLHKNACLNKHNKLYLDNGCVKYREYFDNMFISIDKNIRLDENQRKIILAEERNLLVVAGAGSGKTTTIVGKVKYLIDKKHVNPKRIAIISYTNKATEELQERLNALGCNDVSVYTFHKLGRKILIASGRQIDSIAEEKLQYKIISNYIKQVLFLDKNKFSKFYSAFKTKLYFGDRWKDFDNFKEYHDYMYKSKHNISEPHKLKLYINEQIEKRKNHYKTINGEYLRSKEEVSIANFLFLNGISYQYEKKYVDEIDFEFHYHPDFYINQLENEHYIEHFGISENQLYSKYSKEELEKYLNNMKLKQSFHNQSNNKDRFIITYSSYNDDISTLKHLSDELLKKGYHFERKSEADIYERLKNTSEDMYFAVFIDKLVIPFISNFKSRGYRKEDFARLCIDAPPLIKIQLEVLEDIYVYYEMSLKEKNAIDFEDMINEAYYVLPTLKEKNLGVDYEYVIIDEYQDISMQRFNLTKRIADLFDAKIMAVGDDWQSIFGFSGADISLFQNFRNHLKKAKRGVIKYTYRNSQELVDIARQFIIKNVEQFDKELIAIKYEEFPVHIFIYDDSKKIYTNTNKSVQLEKILNQLAIENIKQKILLLGRYNSDINSTINSNFSIKGSHIIYKKYPKLKIDFLTVHKAKGLGYDQCILINAIDDKYGFPSKIIDEPVIKILGRTSNETIQYAEERRLFYVALTRTKNKIFILTPKTRASSFIREIANYKHIKINSL